MWIECPSESQNRNSEYPAKSPWQYRAGAETAAKTLEFNTAVYSASVKAIKWFRVWDINLMLHNIWQLPHLFVLQAQISILEVNFIKHLLATYVEIGGFTW